MTTTVRKLFYFWGTALLVDGTRSGSGVAEHARFSVRKDGLITAFADSRFRLSILGTPKAGDDVTLGMCDVQPQEQFSLYNGKIRLLHNPTSCLNAKGGISQGAEIVTYPCSHDGMGDNEDFEYGKDGRIRVKTRPEFCLNIKASNIVHGTGLALYQCGTEESHKHDIFDFQEDNTIVPRINPKLRLHARDFKGSGDVILGGCEHDRFDFDMKTMQIRLRNTDLCVNAQGGTGPGASLIAWQCNERDGKVPENEQFIFDEKRRVIHAASDPNLSFNIKEANIFAGAPIVLYPIIVHKDL